MTTKNKKGFTIIEVVLVLAIAGLIFLMVFIALPALQRSQRNTQREDDMARIITAVNDYQTNNNGKTPFNMATKSGVLDGFVVRYIDSECKGTTNATAKNTGFTQCGAQFTDPDGQPYQLYYVGDAPKDTSTDKSGMSVTGTIGSEFSHRYYAYTNATCGDEGMVKQGSGARQIAIFFVMEGGAITCNDNH